MLMLAANEAFVSGITVEEIHVPSRQYAKPTKAVAPAPTLTLVTRKQSSRASPFDVYGGAGVSTVRS